MAKRSISFPEVRVSSHSTVSAAASVASARMRDVTQIADGGCDHIKAGRQRLGVKAVCADDVVGGRHVSMLVPHPGAGGIQLPCEAGTPAFAGMTVKT